MRRLRNCNPIWTRGCPSIRQTTTLSGGAGVMAKHRCEPSSTASNWPRKKSPARLTLYGATLAHNHHAKICRCQIAYKLIQITCAHLRDGSVVAACLNRTPERLRRIGQWSESELFLHSNGLVLVSLAAAFKSTPPNDVDAVRSTLETFRPTDSPAPGPAFTPLCRQSPTHESSPLGSGRGMPGNRHPYRDPSF